MRRRAVIALGILLACCACASALDPSLDISQYAHTAWKISDGFPKGIIFSIAQTPDGYLWLGTEFGLLRFDGVRAVPWQPPAGGHLPGGRIRSLLTARDGTLWIGTDEGLASWKENRLVLYSEFAGRLVASLIEDREGAIWASKLPYDVTEPAEYCRIRDRMVQCYGQDAAFGRRVGQMYEDSKGNLWIDVTGGLLRWKPAPQQLLPMPFATSLIEDNNQILLAATHDGISQLVDGKPQEYHLPGSAGLLFKPSKLLRDRNGGLWIGTTDGGLLHVHQGRTDMFARSDGLSGNFVVALYEDREGNIWVATSNGLDRFRDFAVPTFSAEQGLSSAFFGSVLAAKDGSVWLGGIDGLNRWKDGQVTIYRSRGPSAGKAEPRSASGYPVSTSVRTVINSTLPSDEVESLFEDNGGRIWVATRAGLVYFAKDRFVAIEGVPGGFLESIAEDRAGDMWLSHSSRGLFHLLNEKVAQNVSVAGLGHKGRITSLVDDPQRGGLWLGFSDGGVGYFKDGRVRATFTGADGLGNGQVNALRFGSRGTLWAATQGGLSWIRDGHLANLTSKNGLPCDTVHWSMEDNEHSVWLYMACGLIRITRPELDAWVADSKRTIQVTVFDSSDGVRVNSRDVSSYSPQISESADGRLWFLPGDGVSVIDPRHLAFNQLPPPVYIEQVIADRKTYDATNGLHLPPGVRDLAIDYTALSLVAPEKVRFRYKLEGQDKDWREVVNDRQVQYSNLPPKHYRFRVIAANNSGVWNEQGAALDFVIPPAWYQTNWFYAACVATFLALLWAAYQWRMRQLRYQFEMTLDARVGERTRIARDLHDTLLQSFQALLPLFQAAIYKLPEGAVDSRKTLEAAVDQASQAIGEGRDAVQALRMSTVEKNDLAVAIRTVGEELTAAEKGQAYTAFEVLVEGTPRALHPILRDEVYRLAVEALRNAFRHAAAQSIEVEIHYDEKNFRIRIRDDGKGIDPEILRGEGREGHYGLAGMQERAKLVGGKLKIWTEMDSGTEVELIIPASRAYEKSTRRFWRFGERSATETDVKETIERE